MLWAGRTALLIANVIGYDGGPRRRREVGACAAPSCAVDTDDRRFAELSAGVVHAVERCIEVLHAREGWQALGLLDARRVDLVITDQMMPGLEGWRVVQVVREQWPGLPVLLYSAAPPLRPATVDPACAFDGAQPKPADSDVLLALIAALLPTSVPAIP